MMYVLEVVCILSANIVRESICINAEVRRGKQRKIFYFSHILIFLSINMQGSLCLRQYDLL